MDRRVFLKTGCLAAVPVLPFGCSGPAAAGRANERPLFTFIQLTDTHVNAPYEDATVYTGANQRMQWFVGALNDGTVPTPDFIVHTGDMIHGENVEKLAPDFEVFQDQVLNRLPVPFYPCVGNHENVQRSGIADYDAAYLHTFGPNRKNYTFERDGVVFVVFDTSFEPPVGSLKAHREALRQQRNQWLRGVLAENARPKILCCHIPVVPLREAEVLKKSFGFISWHADDPELLEILSTHRGTVRAVLSGHLHLSGCVRVDDIYHITASGLASYPHDFVFYTVYADRIEVRMTSLPTTLSEPYASNIHGRRRHGVDYTDSLHATGELYVSGNPDERAFSIRLNTKF